MSSAGPNEFSENEDVTRAEPSPPPPRSGLRAGASPENRTDGDRRGCANPCGRDDGPVDCKTLSVRRRLAEELGCCGCADKPETPCLVTEDEGACCRRRPQPTGDAACADPVEQIVNEGLQQQRKRHGRRRSSCGGRRPARPSGRDRRDSYQPDYFDDQADMDNWREHRDRSRRDETRERPRSPAPRPRALAFEPYVDNDPYSPARPSTPSTPAAAPPQNENQDVRQDMLLELQRLDEQRAHLLQCMERERKIVEMVLEYKRQKRACPAPAAEPSDDRQRIHRRVVEAKRKTVELQQRLMRSGAQRCGTDETPSCSSACSPAARCPPTPPSRPSACSPAARCPPTPPSPGNRTSTCAAAAAAAGPETSTSCQRRKLRYRPPSPDTDTDDERCAPPPPRRRLLKYRPPSDGSSEDAANECGRRPSAAADAGDPQSSLQDSYAYYDRSVRRGAPPADVPQRTGSPRPSP